MNWRGQRRAVRRGSKSSKIIAYRTNHVMRVHPPLVCDKKHQIRLPNLAIALGKFMHFIPPAEIKLKASLLSLYVEMMIFDPLEYQGTHSIHQYNITHYKSNPPTCIYMYMYMYLNIPEKTPSFHPHRHPFLMNPRNDALCSSRCSTHYVEWKASRAQVHYMLYTCACIVEENLAL